MLFRPTILIILLLAAFPMRSNGQVLVDTSGLPDVVVIETIVMSGQEVTKEPVITREYLFQEGDTMPRTIFLELLERTRENLLNTWLFNFVTIRAQVTSGNNVAVMIQLEERWYIFPLPIFELVDRNFNEWLKSGDWSRVNFGMNLKWNNFRGMGETMNFIFKWGYTENVGLNYIIPYINRNREEGIAIKTTYNRDKEVIYSVEGSKPLRYNGTSKFVKKEASVALSYFKRKGYYRTSTFFAEYRTVHVYDSVAILNPEYLLNGNTSQQALTFSWLFRRDFRDLKVYPLKGSMLDLEFTKLGFGVLPNEPDLLYFAAQYRLYRQLASRWYAAGSVKGKLSGQSTQPFFNMKGLGFNNDFVRGYELYLVPGQNYILTKTALKFALVPTRVVELRGVPLEKFRKFHYAFYLNGYFDVAYVRDRQYMAQNTLANGYHYGYGLGLDYVTYYNLVFRLEYSFNKFGEKGFFLHFTAPI